MNSQQKYDVVINGGGMVGLATAIGLAQMTNLSIAVFDKSEPKPLSDTPSLRVSAINHTSKNFLSNLNVWPEILNNRHAAYTHMHVWDKHGFGKVAFDQSDVAEDNLGWIIENDNIRYALWQQAQSLENIDLILDEMLSIATSEHNVFIHSAKRGAISADYLIAADGANSWVRSQVGIPMTFRDYDHHAVVATVECELPHRETAWQVFLDTGPLAMLPLHDSNLCSIVWSTSPDEAQQLICMDESEFNPKLAAALDGTFGQLKVRSERHSFPLKMRYAQDFVKSRVVLVGDAAHTIHPLAGQGVNLGFLDAACLIQAFENANSTSESMELALAHFNRWRKSDAIDMLAAMEGIKQIFAPRAPVFKALRGIGLSFVNQFAPAKQRFINEALGHRKNLPNLAKPVDPLA